MPSARNKGIGIANGIYLHFVDADDELVHNGYSNLFAHIDIDNDDIIKFNSITVDSRIEVQKTIDSSYSKLNLKHYHSTQEYVSQNCFPGFVWCYLYKREVILSNSVEFKDVKLAEDALFNICLFCECPHLQFLDYSGIIYKYILREGSEMTRKTKVHLRRCLKDIIRIYTMAERFAIRFPQYSFAISKFVASWKRAFLTRTISGCFSYKEIKSLIQEANECGLISIDDLGESKILQLYKFPFIIWLMSPFYRHIFIPFIKPKIARN